jgi:hypothetical protein
MLRYTLDRTFGNSILSFGADRGLNPDLSITRIFLKSLVICIPRYEIPFVKMDVLWSHPHCGWGE